MTVIIIIIIVVMTALGRLWHREVRSRPNLSLFVELREAGGVHFKQTFMLLKDWLKSHSSEWSLDHISIIVAC